MTHDEAVLLARTEGHYDDEWFKYEVDGWIYDRGTGEPFARYAFSPSLDEVKKLLAFQQRNSLNVLLTLAEVQDYATLPEFRKSYIPWESQPFDEHRELRMVFEIDGVERRLQVEVMRDAE